MDFDLTCTCTIACILLAVSRRNQTRRVLRRAFRRARHIVSMTPRFVGHLSTLVQSTPRMLRLERCTYSPRYSVRFQEPCSPCSNESTPCRLLCMVRSKSEPQLYTSGRPVLPIRRASTCSAKLLASVRSQIVTSPSASDDDSSHLNQPGLLPSFEKLGALFDDLKQSHQDVDVSFLEKAVLELRDQCGFSFQGSDGYRLFVFLSQKGSGPIERSTFQHGIWAFGHVVSTVVFLWFWSFAKSKTGGSTDQV